MNKKELTMTVMERWMDMDHEDLVDLDDDFSEGLMLGTWAIFFHHFLDDEQLLLDLGRGLISVRISRSDSGYLSKMRSEDQPVVSNSIVLPLVITVVGSEVLPRLVNHVVDRVRYESEYRRYLASWNRLDPVGAVVDEVREWWISVITVMRRANSEKKSRKRSIFQRGLMMV